LQSPRSKEAHEFIREQQIDVRAQYKPASRPPDANVLRYHLEEQEFVRVSEAFVNGRRDRDDSNAARPGAVRPLQDRSEGSTIRRRIPFNDDQLAIETVTL
jgi:hypothetical protein